MDKSLKTQIKTVLKKHDVIKAGVFGSYARGDNKKTSDIDILVKFKGQKSLLDLIQLELILKNKLKKKVDLLTYKSINPLLKQRILKEEIKII